MGSPPVAVFLGPSLPAGDAADLLDAIFLPPAEFGDVYRLIGGDVRTIVLVDGVFHGRAPVWHREIVSAMESGIAVVGASSMGALRAAELWPHGMVGVGRVFEQYRDGELDGDDEVALMFSGAEHGYRALSEPLVNLRHNLREAAKAGVVGEEDASRLTLAMKALPFWERTVAALWDTAAFRDLGAARRAGLRAFFAERAVDLKRQDAALALRLVANGGGARDAARETKARGGAASRARSHHDHHRLELRRFPRAGGAAVEGKALIERALAEPSRRRLLRRSAGARFFALEWAREKGISVPDGEREAMAAAWRDEVARPSLPDFLRENGLTASEQRELLERHLLFRWLIERGPGHFGLPGQDGGEAGAAALLQAEALSPIPPVRGVLETVVVRAALARALPFVAAWCHVAGVEPAEAELRGAVWALDKGPVHFGFATWSLGAEVLGELQITGAAAALCASLPAELETA
jgi:hypothetical protein